MEFHKGIVEFEEKEELKMMRNIQLLKNLREALVLADQLMQDRVSFKEKVKTLKEIEGKIGQRIEYRPIYLEGRKGFTEKYVPDSGGYSTPSIPIVEEFEIQSAKYKEGGFQVFHGSREVGEVEGVWILESGRFLVVRTTHFKHSESYWDDSAGPRIYYPYTYEWMGEAVEMDKLPALPLQVDIRRTVTAKVIKALSTVKEIEGDDERDTLLYILQEVADNPWGISLSEFFTGLSSESIEILGQDGLNCLLSNIRKHTPLDDQDHQALARFGSQAVEPLLQILIEESDKSVWGRARNLLPSVVRVLGNIGDKRAVKPIIEILERGNIAVVEEAAKALSKIGNEEAYVPLVKVYARYDKEVEEAERKASMGYGPEPSRELVHVRDVTGEALGKVREVLSEKSLETLIQLLESGDETERRIAVHDLERFGGDRVVDALIHVVKNEPKHASSERLYAVDALASFDSDKAVEALIQISRDKSDPLHRRTEGWLKRTGKRPSFLQRVFRR